MNQMKELYRVCDEFPCLGVGTYSKVFLCEEKASKKLYAMKVCDKVFLKKQKAMDRVRREIQVLMQCRKEEGSENIVHLIQVFEHEKSRELVMIMEYMPHGSILLYDPTIKRFACPVNGDVVAEDFIKHNVLQIIRGLMFLHRKGIAHRDIKPENILLDQQYVAHLSDFGCVYQCDTGNPSARYVTDTSGTFCFFAPECLTGEPYDVFKVDIWALGVTLYCLVCRCLPFYADNDPTLFQRIAEEPIIFQSDALISTECMDLISHLLTKNPNLRISLSDAMHHPWFTEEPPMF